MRSERRFQFSDANIRLDGTHAFLSPSSPHWLNYTDEKLIARLRSVEAAAKGTRLHETAARLIEDGLHLMINDRNRNIAQYVNDAIDLGLHAEKLVFYSPNCFGTADAIGFDPDECFLRVHDLKTGISKTTEKQLYVYAGIFCHQYGYKPFDVIGELRIYQGGRVRSFDIDQQELSFVYDRIQEADRLIELSRQGEE
jgi:hypothetical protein